MKSLVIAFLSLALFTLPTQAQNALDFDGTNDGVNCGTDTAFDVGGTAITIEAWIYAESWKSNIWEGSIVIKENNTAYTPYNSGFMLRAGNGGRLGFGMGVGGGGWTEINTSSSVLSLYTWHHVAVTYDGAKIRLYVDGDAVDSSNASISIGKEPNQPLTIGYHPATGRHWDGRIDEVRLWNVVRSEAELNTYMNDEFCSPQTGLRAYYKLDNGTRNGNNAGVTTAIDYSIYHNNATLTGFALNGTSSNWVGGAGLGQDATYAYDTAHACNQYFYSKTGKLYTSPATITDSLVSASGCDSIRSFYLDIKKNSRDTLDVFACDSFISPTGKKYRKTGTYYNTLPNAAGCDSIITINLTIGKDSGFIDTAVCEVYTGPSGTDYTLSGIYFETTQTSRGCDSIIVITLEVIADAVGTESLNLCDSVLSPSGMHWYYQEGTFFDTLVSYRSCDSIVEVQVIDKKQFDTITATECYSYESVSGNTYTSSGVYLDTISTSECYNVYRTELTILDSSSELITRSGCFEVESPTDSRVFTESGMYFDTLTNVAGCDSFVRMDITVYTVNTTVFQNDQTLVAQSTGSVQWLDCNDNFSEVDGATSKTFLAEISSSYAVEVEENSCIDTSECYSVVGSGFDDEQLIQWNIYPNPSTGTLKIQSDQLLGDCTIRIYDSRGQITYSESTVFNGQWSLNHELAPGMYMLSFEIDGNTLHSIFIVR